MPESIRPAAPQSKARARELRRESTPEEQKLWARLRGNQLGVKFRRQQPLGFYIADFECGLIVELDGSQHARAVDRAYDVVRTEYLEGRQFRVLRFWNNEVRGNLEGVLAVIVETVGQ